MNQPMSFIWHKLLGIRVQVCLCGVAVVRQCSNCDFLVNGRGIQKVVDILTRTQLNSAGACKGWVGMCTRQPSRAPREDFGSYAW
eukprot:6473465-Amphidinium_carterae.1